MYIFQPKTEKFPFQELSATWAKASVPHDG